MRWRQKYYRYFDSFQNAVASIVQNSLVDQMIISLECKDTDHDWRSVMEYQLVIAMAAVKWYELAGDMSRCIEVLLKTFRLAGLEDFTTVGQFILHRLTNEQKDLLSVYYSKFHGSPDLRDFNKPAKWQWYIDHLPE